jgi:hypothetical protein
MMIDMDSLLVKCPPCGAWPLAANVPRTGAQQVITDAPSVSTRKGDVYAARRLRLQFTSLHTRVWTGEIRTKMSWWAVLLNRLGVAVLIVLVGARGFL